MTTIRKMSGFSVLTAVCVVVGMARAASSAPGALDPKFGVGGAARTTFVHSEAESRDVVVQPDRKIVIAGFGIGYGPPPSRDQSTDLVAARLLPDGSPDPTFGEAGVASFGSKKTDERGFAMALQANGGILVAGSRRVGSRTRGLVVRFDATGRPDLAFGNGGRIVVAGFDGATELQSILVTRDGAILVGGVQAHQDAAARWFLLRFRPDGRRDPDFGKNGRLLLPANLAAFDLAEQRDGKIVVAAGTSASGSLAIVRLLADGSTDLEFGNRGVARGRSDAAVGFATCVTLDAEDRIVAAGQGPMSRIAFETEMIVARFLAGGQPDRSFGRRGTVRTQVGPDSWASDVVVTPTGQILVGGATQRFNGRRSMVLARHRDDGSLDPAFGVDGLAITSLGAEHSLFAMALQDETHLVAAGWTFYQGGLLGTEALVSRHLF